MDSPYYSSFPGRPNWVSLSYYNLGEFGDETATVLSRRYPSIIVDLHELWTTIFFIAKLISKIEDNLDYVLFDHIFKAVTEWNNKDPFTLKLMVGTNTNLSYEDEFDNPLFHNSSLDKSSF